MRRMEKPVPLRIGGVTLAVRDLETVAGFYREVVGLDVLARDGEMARLGAGGVAFLELHQDRALRPRDPGAAGLYHTAFLLPGRDDLGRWLRHAAELGFRLDGAADHLVSEAVYLHDPEGNGVEIYADRPREAWTWQGDMIVMANDRLDMVGLRALASERWTGAPERTRIGHVHLQVGDTAAAERFYGDGLGLAVTRRGPQVSFLSSGRYHHHVAANTWHSAGAGPRERDRAGLDGVTLLAAGQDVIDGVAARLDDPGVDPWGTRVRFTLQEGI